MSDATKVKQVDNQHAQLEADLEDIFGIPDGTPITSPIFGVNPEDSSKPPIQRDGSIRGVPRFTLVTAVTDAGNSVGLEFEDDTSLKRLCFVNSRIEIHESEDDGETWTRVSNLEDPYGSGLLTALTDVALDALSSTNSGQVLRVTTSAPYKFELVAPSLAGGRTKFTDLDDVGIGRDLLASDNGDIIGVVSGKLNLVSAPASIGDPWLMELVASSRTPWPRDLTEDAFIQAYQWTYVPDVSGQTIQDQNLLSDISVDKLNGFIELEAGLYEVSVWYNADNIGGTGIREWKIVASTATIGGAASFRGGSPLPIGYDEDGLPILGNYTHFLGTRTLNVTASGKVYLAVRQDGYNNMTGVMWYMSILGIK
jgi:hypothetical protein